MLKKFSRKARRDLDLLRDYKRVFGSVEGQRVLHDLMKQGFMFQNPCTGNTEGTFKNIGRQSLVQDILRILEMDGQRLIDTLKRAKQEEMRYESD